MLCYEINQIHEHNDNILRNITKYSRITIITQSRQSQNNMVYSHPRVFPLSRFPLRRFPLRHFPFPRVRVWVRVRNSIPFFKYYWRIRVRVRVRVRVTLPSSEVGNGKIGKRRNGKQRSGMSPSSHGPHLSCCWGYDTMITISKHHQQDIKDCKY